MIKKKLWSEESDFSEYSEEDDEDNKEDNEDEDNEDQTEDDETDNEEDEENEDNEEEETEDIEENEDEEEYNEDDEYNDVDDELDKDDDGILLVDEEVLKPKRKREYILNKKDVKNQINNFNYNNMSEEQFISNIKQYLEKITTQKNSEILMKNIIESVKDINSIDQKYSEILNKVNYLVYFYSMSVICDGAPVTEANKKSIKEIQSDIKNNNIGFYNSSDNNFWDIYRESIKKEVNKIKQPVEVVDGLYTCSKCKGTVTQSYSIQTRRSDEPPTVFIHCMNKLCLHKWREG